MDVCLKVLKESKKAKFDSYRARKSILIISHITFRDCRVHIFLPQPFLKQLYVARVSAKTVQRYFKMQRNKSFDFRAKFRAIYSASKIKTYLLKNNPIGNWLLFSNTGTTCPENANWWLFLPQSNLFFEISKQFQSLNFERLLVTDFYSNDFSQISLT